MCYILKLHLPTIDFIPAGVDFKERVAIGSRKAAMLQRQKRYYASGRVKPGILMACRVLTVGNNTMMVTGLLIAQRCVLVHYMVVMLLNTF